MIEALIQFDHILFTYLNNLHLDWLDPIMKVISGKLTWAPLYLLMLIGIIKHYGKKTFLIVGLVALLITASDQLSQGFKYGFKRYRPCQELSNHQPKPHIVDGKCGGKYSFFSAHSANSFAIAFFIGALLIPVWRKSKKTLLIWAVVVAYSRVYLGVHYPADIVVGAIFGILLAMLFLYFYKLIAPRIFKN